MYCEGSYDQENTIEELEGLGTIMTYEGEMDFSYMTLVPATYVAQKDGDKVDRYINSTKYACFICFALVFDNNELVINIILSCGLG